MFPASPASRPGSAGPLCFPLARHASRLRRLAPDADGEPERAAPAHVGGSGRPPHSKRSGCAASSGWFVQRQVVSTFPLRPLRFPLARQASRLRRLAPGADGEPERATPAHVGAGGRPPHSRRSRCAASSGWFVQRQVSPLSRFEALRFPLARQASRLRRLAPGADGEPERATPAHVGAGGRPPHSRRSRCAASSGWFVQRQVSPLSRFEALRFPLARQASRHAGSRQVLTAASASPPRGRRQAASLQTQRLCRELGLVCNNAK